MLLGQLLYWTPRTRPEAEGWIYKTQPELEDETGLSRREQETARKKLRERGILHERKAGVPAKLYFRIDLDVLSDLYDESYPSPKNSDPQLGGIRQTRVTEPAKQTGAKAPTQKPRYRQPLLGTETTDREHSREYKQPPKPPTQSGPISQLSLSEEAAHDLENPQNPKNPKPAAKSGDSDPPSEADVADWLTTYREATPDEVTHVLGELVRKGYSNIEHSVFGYAHRVLQTYRNHPDRRAEAESERPWRAGDPLCEHENEPPACPECKAAVAAAKARIDELMKVLSERMSA